MLDYDSWSIPEQIDSIYRATRININFYSRSCGRITGAFWKWNNFCKFALSVLSVCSQFYHIYFNCIFNPKGDTFWINFDMRAHIRIFQTFRICINFYAILKIEPAMLDLLSTLLDMLWEQKIGFFAFFGLGKSDTFYVC